MSDKNEALKTIAIVGGVIAGAYLLSRRSEDGQDQSGAAGVFPSIDLSGLISGLEMPEISMPEISMPEISLPAVEMGSLLPSGSEIAESLMSGVSSLGDQIVATMTDGLGSVNDRLSEYMADLSRQFSGNDDPTGEGGSILPDVIVEGADPIVFKIGKLGGGEVNIDPNAALGVGAFLATPFNHAALTTYKALGKIFDVEFEGFEPLKINVDSLGGGSLDLSVQNVLGKIFEYSPVGMTIKGFTEIARRYNQDQLPDLYSEVDRIATGEFSSQLTQDLVETAPAAVRPSEAQHQIVTETRPEWQRWDQSVVDHVASTFTPAADSGMIPYGMSTSMIENPDTTFLGYIQHLAHNVQMKLREAMGSPIVTPEGAYGLSLDQSSQLRHAVFNMFGEANPCSLVGSGSLSQAQRYEFAGIIADVERRYGVTGSRNPEIVAAFDVSNPYTGEVMNTTVQRLAGTIAKASTQTSSAAKASSARSNPWGGVSVTNTRTGESIGTMVAVQPRSATLSRETLNAIPF